MAIITSRVRNNGTIYIDYQKCTDCGLCVNICKDNSLQMENGHVVASDHPVFGCYGCGHCMAICPEKAIHVEGRELSIDDLISIPKPGERSDYEQLRNLMLSRRSIRDFKKKEVEKEVIDKIIDAALTAPMGLPPSDVHLLVFEGYKKVREFAFSAIDQMGKAAWLFMPPGLWLWRLFGGKEAFELMKGFGWPLISKLVSRKQNGEDWLLYDAPLAMYFLSSPYSDPVDPVIPATYAMLAAESLGLGTCMIGSIHPLIRYGAKKFKRRWNIPQKSTNGIVVIFGYPKYKFQHALKRTFAQVTVYEN